ncbi:MAG: bifunctional precorrin-2 dehydrogenase/sirohydrochlorin ferrochelatase [Deltaproteobacteria bacterium]|nr:bifunctional precorrin-2 dehydrogenase/sirohydrochlorin ferrochelatase [Deltaproteobacteria bacterium]
MSTYDFPIALQLEERSVVLVGGGRIAQGRLAQLLEVGAQVRVIDPKVTPELRALADAGRIELVEREYRSGDCAGAFLVFTAAEVPEVNRSVVAEARARRILVNAADVPELCDFTMPSIGRRGPVTVAVSTSGRAPALARFLRKRAMVAIGEEFGTLARLLGRLRELTPGGPDRAAKLQAVIDAGAAELIAMGRKRELWRAIRQIWRSRLATLLDSASAGLSEVER